MGAQTISTTGNLKMDLSGKLKALLNLAPDLNTDRSMVRVELPIEPCDPLQWLRAQKFTVKIYWSGRDSTERVAGIGCADRISSPSTTRFDQLQKSLSQRISPRFSSVRYYGGICFDQQKLSPEWRLFRKYQFIVPRFEIITKKEHSFLACNLSTDELFQENCDAILKEFDRIIFTSPKIDAPTARLQSFTDRPTVDAWQKNVIAQIKKIKKGIIKKVVLARQAELKFSRRVDAGDVFEKLAAVSLHCYHFYFQFSPNKVFIGASPERLFKRKGLKIKTEALAGTRPRGETIDADKKLKEALLNSEKDWQEHQIVADWIRNVLNPMCTQFQSDRTFSSVSLKSGHHLITRMEGELLETIDDMTLIERLHPTPAVGGWPKEEALNIIRKAEPFNRGYYAAPVGFIGHDEAEFAVAIRSGLIDGKTVRLYAGAGIVDASQPTEEWEETQNKLKVFLTALGV